MAKDPPSGGDLALRQDSRRHLVQQRLEQVMLGPGDHRDIDGRLLERPGRGQATETRPDDDDAVPAHVELPSGTSA